MLALPEAATKADAQRERRIRPETPDIGTGRIVLPEDTVNGTILVEVETPRSPHTGATEAPEIVCLRLSMVDVERGAEICIDC
jgi:hypothetical protein